MQPIDSYREKIEAISQGYGNQGFRVLGVGYRFFPEQKPISVKDEDQFVFLGFILLEDPLKAGIKDTIQAIQSHGVSLRILTGDSVFVARHIAEEIGVNHSAVLTGKEIAAMSDGALLRRVDHTIVYAELEPYQKERLVNLFKRRNHIVGFLGDGINDSLAIKAADVGLSVNNAVDIAKEEADIILLEKDLGVLGEGIQEGRKIFANTLKYIFMATSANFGNMFSMAAASLFLPFLPMLPKQILLSKSLDGYARDDDFNR